jgi:hypothetical protein
MNESENFCARILLSSKPTRSPLITFHRVNQFRSIQNLKIQTLRNTCKTVNVVLDGIYRRLIVMLTRVAHFSIKAKIAQYSQVVLFDSFIGDAHKSYTFIEQVIVAIHVIMHNSIEIFFRKKQKLKTFSFIQNRIIYHDVSSPKNSEFTVRSRRIASACQSLVNSTSACLP